MVNSTQSIQRHWVARASDGTEHQLVLTLGLPMEKPGGEWGVVVNLGCLEQRQHEIFGVDAWQAVQLGMRLAASRLNHFSDQGWRYFWERGGDAARPEDLVGVI